LESAETDAHDTAAAVAISGKVDNDSVRIKNNNKKKCCQFLDFLYGNVDGSDLKKSVKDRELLHALAKYTTKDWTNVLRKWYLDAPHVTLYGKPSSEFAEQQTEEETNRVDKQRADLGETKLKELQKELDDAMAKNDVPIPKELLENFKIPLTSTIKFINVVTARNNDDTL
jgi:Zn-dependent M16 (insulinase) family peptidase